MALTDDGEGLAAAAWRAEEALLRADVRSDARQLAVFLASDFYEIGQSGRRWGRDEIIAALASDDETLPHAVLTERESTLVTSDVVLLSYVLEFGPRSSRRSSLWRRVDGSVECFFHQGTSLP